MALSPCFSPDFDCARGCGESGEWYAAGIRHRTATYARVASGRYRRECRRRLFPGSPHLSGLALFVSGTVMVLLLLSAVVIAVQGERKAEREGQKPRMVPFIGMIVCSFGFVGFGAWYFWPPSVPQREAAPLQAKETLQSGAQKQVSLLWECQTATVPNVVPSGGVNTIEAMIDDNGTDPNVGFGFSNVPPGSPYRRDHFPAQKCSLINFGDETIFDVTIVFNVSFTTISDGHNGSKVIAKVHSPNVHVRSLDRGRDHPYDIYILNLSRKFAVNIELPTTASYVTAGDSTRKEAKFLPLGMNELFMTLFPATH
jgi:hypothetical protein